MIRPAEVPLNNRLLELIAKSQRRESWRDAGGYRQHLQRQYVQWAWGARLLTKKTKKPKATWLKPKLLVDAEYRVLSGTGKLRHPRKDL